MIQKSAQRKCKKFVFRQTNKKIINNSIGVCEKEVKIKPSHFISRIVKFVNIIDP